MLGNMFFLNVLAPTCVKGVQRQVPNKRTIQWLSEHKNRNFWTKKRPENPGVKRSA